MRWLRDRPSRAELKARVDFLEQENLDLHRELRACDQAIAALRVKVRPLPVVHQPYPADATVRLPRVDDDMTAVMDAVRPPPMGFHGGAR